MIDAHCHIDQYKNPISIAEECERKKIFTIAVTNLPTMFEEGYPFLERFEYVNLALGFHPLLADKHKNQLDKFELFVRRTKFIGEIGLDFSYEGIEFKNNQIDCLRSIFEFIKGDNKIISLHCRRAENDLLDLLEEFNIKKSILHWYSGPIKSLTRAIETGCFFSINPKMMMSVKGKKIIQKIPKERVLTETDGPFVKINNRPARPSDVSIVHYNLAQIWNQEPEQIKKQIIINLNGIIGKNN